MHPPKISVIIPVLNEARVLAGTLSDLRRQAPDEVILSDGFSDDAGAAIARSIGARWIQKTRGRAAQMNAGARAASGDAFLFLHADTRLPPGGMALIREALADGRVCGGRFRTAFDHGGWRYRLLASYTRFAFFSYGDQGFFVRRRTFEDMGGFDPRASFEDVDFYRRLRQRGRTVILPAAVTTSARRFEKNGFIRQKAVNFILAGVYQLGFNPKPLMKRWYKDVR